MRIWKIAIEHKELYIHVYVHVNDTCYENLGDTHAYVIGVDRMV